MASIPQLSSAESASAKARAVIRWREAGAPAPAETRGPWLKHLEMLNLSSNPQLTLPTGFLSHLANLKSLMLDGYAHADVPPETLQIAQIKQLTFDHSKISALPDSIAGTTGFRQLCLEHAQLAGLPTSLATMSVLREAARRLNFMLTAQTTLWLGRRSLAQYKCDSA
jgi:hypothetical protein